MRRPTLRVALCLGLLSLLSVFFMSSILTNHAHPPTLHTDKHRNKQWHRPLPRSQVSHSRSRQSSATATAATGYRNGSLPESASGTAAHPVTKTSGNPLVSAKSSSSSQDRRNETAKQRADNLQRTCRKLGMVATASDTSSNKLKHAMHSRFIIDQHHHLLYCPLEKVGSSFWKRVFQILTGEGHASKNTSVFDLSGVLVHRIQGMRKINKVLWRNFSDVLPTVKKFMFVRDPYERLFSGFVDKLLIPTYETKRIVHEVFKSLALSKMYRTRFEKPEESFEEMNPGDLVSRNLLDVNHTIPASSEGNEQSIQKNTSSDHVPERKNSSIPQHPLFSYRPFPHSGCKLRATFADFVRYVIKGVWVNEHFRPMWQQCPPCLLNYDFLGKMETFRQDVHSILTSAGVSPKSVLSSDVTFDRDSDVNILHDIIKRTFEVVKRYQACMTQGEMLVRMWTAFQIRGLLSINQSFPLTTEESNNVTQSQFIHIVDYTYARSGPREVRMRQRKAAMLEAFYGLPRSVLERLEKQVKKDCQLFGYECSVDKRFPLKDLPHPVFNFERFAKDTASFE